MRTASPGVLSLERVVDGRFPLLQQLGGTEWSAAYLTRLDDGRAQRAAIKIFPFDSVDPEITLARWNIARTLAHPHLMPLFYAGRCAFEGEDLLYVVTEYADETLSQILPERPLSPEEAREMLSPVLGALAYLNNRDLTHGHLRPTNIMVVNDQLKLSPDFGWRSRARNIYDPPEAGIGNPAPTADIWSLGVLLIEALTQQLPVLDKWQGGEPEIPANVPEPFFTICRECLRIDPERRCSLAGIRARLNPGKAAGFDVPPAEATVDRSANPSYGLRAVIAAGAALALLLLFAAFKFGWDATPTSPEPAAQSSVPEAAATPRTPGAGAAAPTAEPGPRSGPVPGRSMGGVVKGLVTHQVLPDIPGSILGTIQGRVKVGVRVVVNAEGKVSQASIDAPGPSRYFANQALHAAQSWTFAPAQVDGRAAASTWLLEFQFDASQAAVTPTEESP